MCLLKVTLSDRTNVHIPSGKTWSSSFGPLSDSQIYNGKIYDSGKSPLWRVGQRHLLTMAIGSASKSFRH
jgi:predicted heme/steroid binding protein